MVKKISLQVRQGVRGLGFGVQGLGLAVDH